MLLKTLLEIEFLMVPATHPSLPASIFYVILFTSTGKTGTHTSSVVGHMIRSQCVYRAREYFIDNYGEIECISYFKIRLLSCNSKVVWNNSIKFICTKALRYASRASPSSILIKSFEYGTNPKPPEWFSGDVFGHLKTQLWLWVLIPDDCCSELCIH